MAYTAEQQTAMDAAKTAAKQAAGVAGKSFASMSDAEKKAYQTALAKMIIEDPTRYGEQALESAQRMLGNLQSGAYDPITYSVGEMLSDFGYEVANQAQAVTSAAGLTIRRAVYIAAGAAVLFYLSPYVLPKLRKALK